MHTRIGCPKAESLWSQGRAQACRQRSEEDRSGASQGSLKYLAFCHHYLIAFLQAQKSYDEVASKIASLRSVVDEAEDDIFADFCRRIGATDVREYENRQLKVAQEEQEAKMRFETQLKRLQHQCVLSLPLSLISI